MDKPELISFLYHDITAAGSRPKSYSIDSASFEKQVSALSASGKPATLISNPLSRSSYLFTFDDGNESAITRAAPILEKYGARGHFFIITANIGKPGYLNEEQIKELHHRGHCIGSHSHSHNPLKNSDAGEWLKSIEILSGILKEKITVASVPGGWYSKAVALAAANAGIEWLFTSEPIATMHKEENCTILGRFSVSHQATGEQIIHILKNKFPAREKQWLAWNLKKIAKTFGGKTYLKFRNWYFNTRQ